MRWTQIRQFFVAVGLITVFYGLVIIGRMTAGASVSLWGINPTATAPAPAPPAPAPVLVPPSPAPVPPVVVQVAPAPVPPPAPAPVPASSDETLERSFKGKLLTEGENP